MLFTANKSYLPIWSKVLVNKTLSQKGRHNLTGTQRGDVSPPLVENQAHLSHGHTFSMAIQIVLLMALDHPFPKLALWSRTIRFTIHSLHNSKAIQTHSLYFPNNQFQLPLNLQPSLSNSFLPGYLGPYLLPGVTWVHRTIPFPRCKRMLLSPWVPRTIPSPRGLYASISSSQLFSIPQLTSNYLQHQFLTCMVHPLPLLMAIAITTQCTSLQNLKPKKF